MLSLTVFERVVQRRTRARQVPPPPPPPRLRRAFLFFCFFLFFFFFFCFFLFFFVCLRFRSALRRLRQTAEYAPHELRGGNQAIDTRSDLASWHVLFDSSFPLQNFAFASFTATKATSRLVSAVLLGVFDAIS